MEIAKGKRRMRASISTVRYKLTLPSANHPIWKMGYHHVSVAFSICCAFAVLNSDNSED